ncbi:hypothetical protein DFJ58DRAFT_794829 [Suillus subalutaceus]|uniref:uncharacterized protein n=1 Tax=Suillus subalutaceus TaxID=48586 RepID=UPI001B878318|nr:uncharacterized protein DFJ58DRAFT_794829 [Suillus subalutaceus]KAG1849705.1 hypothetical protein DFJ58DRAFT_794829 [Suillus subalutaceus]
MGVTYRLQLFSFNSGMILLSYFVSANWTSYYGLEKAASLKTLPFLALRSGRQGQFLFAISSGKPTGVNDGCYFALGSSLSIERKTLHVEPSLRPSGRTLYVHTFPRLLEDAQFQISPVTVPHLPHRLDEATTFIYQDLLLYNQLAADYSWMGITAAVKWALKSRDHYHAYRVRRGGALLPGYSLKAHACNSLSMKIPLTWTGMMGPMSTIEFIPNYMPPVPAPSTRAIAFDIFGTILDRDGAINEAMRLLSPTYPDNRHLSKVYLECELMRHRDHTDAPYNDIVRHRLQDVCTVLEAPPSEAVLQEAIQTILQPGFICRCRSSCEDAPDPGYVLVCLPIPGVKSFLLPQLPSGLTLHDQPAPLSDLLPKPLHIFGPLGALSFEMWNHRQGPRFLYDPTLAVDGLQGLQCSYKNLSALHHSPVERTPNSRPVPTHRPADCRVALRSSSVQPACVDTQGYRQCKWSGIDRGSHILILDQVGAKLSLKTVVMLAIEMLDRIEFVHSRGVILRDIKPENFAMGVGENSHVVYLFDFGLAKLSHIPFREGRVGLGTPRYASYNVHFGREQGRRDDLEALGNVLLFLLHGRLPWQGVYSPSLEAKLLRMGEMKAGSAFRDLLTRSPVEFTTYFDHCRGLKQLFNQILVTEGWTENSRFDWEDGSSRKDIRFTKDDVSTLQYVGPYIHYAIY